MSLSKLKQSNKDVIRHLDLAITDMNMLMSEIEAISTHPKFKSNKKELHKIACKCAEYGAALWRIQILSK